MERPTSPRIAYFCMEYGLHPDLSVYSGGLGVLAGDVLKSARDARLSMLGVGLLWGEGYTVQRVGPDGWPTDEYPATSRDRLERLDVSFAVRIRDKDIPLCAYRVSGDHAPLLLMEPRDEADRWLTRRLYQGGYGDRVAQELVLGVGGMRLLRALREPVDVFHLNEGHAVFAVIELVRERMMGGASWDEARAWAREQVVFTTHTPVMAGNEAHDVNLLLEQGAGLGVLGRAELESLAGEPFSMTVAGLRLSRRANAVSQLHAQTARQMWAHVHGAAPIVGITNGVHVPTWQDPRMRAAVGNGDPWVTHHELKAELIRAVRERTGVELAPDRLTVGFARRAAPYKRADLIFRDMNRVGRLLESGRIQLVYAGKAHPDNAEGKGLISNIVHVARRFPRSVVFLENYEMELGKLLTRGCDAWLNTPRRPLEASGTSGMKAALNGVLNVGVLDGWWAEACEHGVNGWAVGGGYEGPGQDEHDTLDLLRLLEEDVLPTYEGDRDRWVAMMRASVESTQWRFSSVRMLQEYRRKLY
jgi:starch phosphorylase